MQAFNCAFEECLPFPADEMTTDQRAAEAIPLVFGNYPTFGNPIGPQCAEWHDPSNPMYNLPSKVLFPRVAGDVIAAIKFAKEHSVEISVKNSGHSL